MKRTFILLSLATFLAGCTMTPGQFSPTTPDTVRCAENWSRQGFHFDPNSMTCSQMWEKAQVVRRTAYWNEKGYKVDPNLMTWQQVDQKVSDIDRSRYWKLKGYDFDPNTMTAREMDQKIREVKEIQFWKASGYYYDPVSENVYVDAEKRTLLSSLPAPTGSWYSSSYLSPSLSSRYSSAPSSGYSYSGSCSSGITSPLIAENGSYYGQISENTGKPKTVHVNGYYRKDGTYVRGYYRSK
jgi:hypothetical protein